MNDSQRGLLAMTGACLIWGLSPLYYKLVEHVPPLEVLCYRTLWSLVFFGAVVVAQRQVGRFRHFIAGNWKVAGLAAVLISLNWGFFIWSIQAGRVMESSLGYYIFPLVAVLIGAVFFRETLTPLQWLAVGFAAAGVAVRTYGIGVVPRLALVLAITFSLYGIIKRQLRVGAILSVTGEVLLLAPLAAAWLLWTGTGHAGGAGASDLRSQLLLSLSGPLTAGPLILYSFAAQRVRLATLGLLQYLNPTLQFLCAALVLAEPFTRWHGITFALIWVALALYSAQGLFMDRAARRRSISVGTSGTL
ncbi:EamA family transporter RarD [Tropicimonas sp. IMCC6043]|uniref:EamA family transporter RarD n=1 Tax=Tropicimonas sp. IMCC6043 TaxID=2510645 RepID=UPI00101D1567|nr:EamA family transporter RarD [Tropicimonas sp. IMCC6043]RYH10638.1 EamA family transporter RarD [Tropicimonas sp. IMCC6043]